MFKIVDLQRSKTGFLVTIETDDPEELHLISFIKAAHEFSERYINQIRTQGKILHRKETAEHRKIEDAARRSRILTLFRQLPGSRSNKISLLRDLLRARGEEATYDRVRELLAIAGAEHREVLAGRIEQLRGEGAGWREIGRVLQLPESTVRTLFKNRSRMPQETRSPLPAGQGVTPLPDRPMPLVRGGGYAEILAGDEADFAGGR